MARVRFPVTTYREQRVPGADSRRDLILRRNAGSHWPCALITSDTCKRDPTLRRSARITMPGSTADTCFRRTRRTGRPDGRGRSSIKEGTLRSYGPRLTRYRSLQNFTAALKFVTLSRMFGSFETDALFSGWDQELKK